MIDTWSRKLVDIVGQLDGEALVGALTIRNPPGRLPRLMSLLIQDPPAIPKQILSISLFIGLGGGHFGSDTATLPDRASEPRPPHP